MRQLTNGINLPSIEELACFRVRVCRNGDIHILHFPNELDECFLPRDKPLSNPFDF